MSDFFELKIYFHKIIFSICTLILLRVQYFYKKERDTKIEINII